ncbi:MAG: ABC transporter permease [Oscillospiraceae bacterium]|nr:ABC transporter permease [Oscillospiraceae bacterium]
MKNLRSLPLRNLTHAKCRTLLLTILTALLAFCLSGGCLMIASMTDGMSSLEARLGADVIVVPSSAKSKVNVDQILLNGTTGYFYMPRDRFEQIAQTEGVAAASPQLFLCSLKADCCAAAIQIIGFDSETDFIVQPWLRSRYSGALSAYEVVAGCEIGAEVGQSIKIYGKSCKVVARLDKTGTGFDTAIYTTNDNIRMMMADAQALGINQKLTDDPDTVVSAVYIRVQDGYTPEQVANNINVHVRKVEAVQTRSMLSGVSDSLVAMTKVFRNLMLLVCVLCVVILFIAFGMMTGERRNEFALLRMLGYSRKRLMAVVMEESLIVSLMGAGLGVMVGGAVVCLFSQAIAAQLSLPFMVPSAGVTVLIGIISLLATHVTCAAASVWSARRLSRTDTGILMREGH